MTLQTARRFDQKERPDGTNITGVLSQRWLQNYVDLFHQKFPLSSGLSCATITFQAGMAEYAFPTDFIQVYRNGMYLIAVNNGDPVGRLRQTSLDKAIEFASQFPLRTGQPGRFVVTGNGIFQVFPTPDKSYNAEIWYYALPAVLGQSDIPPFPPDHILIDTLHLRQREWLQMVASGSALAYAHSAIAELQKAGISNEPEPDEIDLDPDVFRRPSNATRGDWMGDSVPR